MTSGDIASPRRAGDARNATLALLDARAPGATVCPSEVARALAEDWRAAMPAVHAAVDALVAAGTVRLSWKGVMMTRRDGPYRIGRGAVEG